MDKEQINALFNRFEDACYLHEGVECWSARELQEILGYSRWENFKVAMERGRKACEVSDNKVLDHFRDVTKMVGLGSGAQRPVEDVALTRYACYLIAQNGDPSKPEIAFAQTYFAVQTRKQELVEKRLLDVARVSARGKLTKSEKDLSGIFYERGVDERGFGVIRSKGDQALFGGFTTSDMKRKLGVPESRPLADFLPTLTIKAKDFAAELTGHNVVDKDLKGETPITKEHVDNNAAVRRMLAERGVKPEALPPAEDLKKVQRRLEGEEKKLVEAGRKSKRGK
ncbi:MAG: DNA damage-inducible protein D [Bacteroidetes bacterium]|nr:DNA damage-inducible protein D [Bacteroidota bacterium]